ncbi:DUF4907 domain-containing protein [Maribacter sp. MMG018]|uniref:DUF4907 domain-containing protein n=1 Tax=Maribacter sp. MMG018 TaxID=2822688 RepID=UPI001B364727|nr:DUF4907 domain-containing protein [Maribacter sp. MMG018]MBQ4914521.1 DUF4907 domain-containing protein [Maribacter sp. MMG018]
MKGFLTFVIGICIVGIMYIALNNDKKDQVHKNAHYLYGEVIDQGDGYGYRIYNGEKLIIQQETIPGFVGEIAFATHDDADKVAKCVMGKLLKGVNPTITLEELNALGIGMEGNKVSNGVQ